MYALITLLIALWLHQYYPMPEGFRLKPYLLMLKDRMSTWVGGSYEVWATLVALGLGTQVIFSVLGWMSPILALLVGVFVLWACFVKITPEEAMIWQAQEGIFSVMFWFGLLGPMGAVVYRAVKSFEQTSFIAGEENELLNKLAFLMDWIPVRVTLFIFGLVGRFVPTFKNIQLMFKEPHPQLVEHGARQALEKEELELDSVLAYQNLLIRSLLAWVLLIGLWYILI